MLTDAFAAIFDMDGVLIDTYQAHYRSWAQMARAEGLEYPEEDFRRTFGRTSREIIAAYWGDGLSPDRIAAMDEKKETLFRQTIEADFPAMPGAVALLTSLHDAGFRLAVGSSGPSENVALTLDRMNVRGLFGAVITGGDVTRGKPDPQVFQLAAQRVGVPPARCVVIEDAPVGIDAAAAAGMASVGFASTGRTREQLVAADCVIDSLSELSPEVLRNVILRRGGR